MKWLSVLIVVLLTVARTQAQSSDDQYVSIYNLIQEGDLLSNNNQPRHAIAKYVEAQSGLEKFRKGYPDWNPKVVNFRLTYVANKIATLSASLPSEQIQSNAVTRFSATATLSPGQAAAPAPPADWENQINTLNSQVRQLQTDKGLLEAKLKEALAARPAAMDPRELARAEEKIRNLLKENDLLKLSLDQQKSSPAPAAKIQESDANRQALLQENQILKKQLAELKALPPANASVEDVGRQLALARTQIASLESDREMLRLEKEGLEQRIKALPTTSPKSGADQVRKLQQERDGLQKQLDTTKLALNTRNGELNMARSVASDQKVALARDADMITKLQRERDLLRKQLEARRGKAPSAVAATPVQTAEETGRINKLEQERDELRKQLDAANKELSSRKGKVTTPRLVEMENQVAGLRARLEVFEARSVPYSPEELALFRKPEARLAQPDAKTGQGQTKEMSPASVALVAEAQRYFSAKQYEKAEEKYLQVLSQDQPNGATLANLAAVELELNHLDKAETNIKQAIALSPNDPYNLTVLGRLKFRQTKYDDALDALSRAAKSDPQNAEIQNFLGLTLSGKGLRGPAEVALRKAIQIEPGYGEAHNNLAVIYITQQPPLVELARWHYQKALEAGSPHNADLERMIEAKKPAEGGQ
jgi:Tfp pilus assembly protein PilF